MNAPPAPLLARFATIVGERYALTSADDVSPFLTEQRDKYRSATPMVLRPGTIAEVAAIVALANDTRTPIIPQGGNTGLVGGQIPITGDEIVVSLSRLNRIRSIDAAAFTMTVEAGAILADIQKAAENADRLFPLSLASEGSCEIGGNISTNAGGTAVLAYGNTRDLVLGLEVVLPSGDVWNGLRTLRKDNTGYDLKHLFIGAEGTLGIVTAAVLKLFPRPRGVSVAIAGVADPDAALALYAIARERAGAALTAAELMPRLAIETVLNADRQMRDPLGEPHGWYLLLEISSPLSQQESEATIEAIFAEAFEIGVAEDAVRAESLAQADALWKMRHALSEVQKTLGGSIKHDVAVPVSAVPELIRQAAAVTSALVPGSIPFPFGHLGDGNLHLNLTQPPGMDKAAFLARWDEVNAAVYAVVTNLGGTISAEHGIGQMKRALLPKVKSPVEIGVMRAVKAALDPNGIMNPGKVL